MNLIRTSRSLLRAIASALSLAVGLALIANTASAALLDHRPKNFFSALWQKDKEVCETVLKSLNKEYLIPKDLYGVRNPNFITDLLLTSDLQVPWQRIPLKYDGAQWGLDYVSVDLANDGQRVPIFRWDFYDRAGSRNELILPSTVPDEIIFGKPPAEDIIRRLSGPNAKNVLRIGPSDLWTRDTYPLNGMFDFNLLRVGNRVFLLGAGSIDAERTAWKGGGFNAFVMEYRSMQDISVVCHFRGGKKAGP